MRCVSEEHKMIMHRHVCSVCCNIKIIFFTQKYLFWRYFLLKRRKFRENSEKNELKGQKIRLKIEVRKSSKMLEAPSLHFLTSIRAINVKKSIFCWHSYHFKGIFWHFLLINTYFDTFFCTKRENSPRIPKKKSFKVKKSDPI